MSNRKKIIKNINKTKDHYRKMKKSISTNLLADVQDQAKLIVRKQYKIRPLLHKRIEQEIDSEFFRQVFPAKSELVIDGERFNKISKEVYFLQIERHGKLFAFSLKTKDYAMKYIICIKDMLFPAPEEIEKYKENIMSLKL